MQWPWTKTEPAIEKRESFTDALVSAILSSRGESAALAQDTAVAEIAAGQLGRTLSSGILKPASPMIQSMITPHMLTTVGYEIIKNGECCFWISPDGALVPSSYWDINGSYDPKTWQYRLDLSGPSSNGTVNVNSREVLHFRYRSDTIRPWRSVGPLQGAGLTSKLVSGLERMLGNETSAQSGYLLPIPEFTDAEDDPAQGLKDDLAKLKGRTTLIETSQNAFGEGRVAAPARDYVPSRIGADPPGSLIALREQAANYLLTACGYPVGLMASGDGQSQREGLRRYQNFVASIARAVCAEISAKLHVADCHIDLPSIQDVASRSRAFSQLVAGGMDIERAVSLAGLLLSDDD